MSASSSRKRQTMSLRGTSNPRRPPAAGRDSRGRRICPGEAASSLPSGSPDQPFRVSRPAKADGEPEGPAQLARTFQAPASDEEACWALPAAVAALRTCEGCDAATAFLARIGLSFTDRFTFERGFVARTLAGRFP
jgi:hypothetical protein